MDTLLSRLNITGKLDGDTPIDVILEIADAHNIDYSSLKGPSGLNILIEQINSEDVPSVRKTLVMDDYYNIAIFVNSKIEWKSIPLEAAYKFLKSFNKKNRFLELRSDFTHGAQTTQCPTSVCNSIVYGACKYFGIPLARETLEEEMVQMLRDFLDSPESITQFIATKIIALNLSPDVLLKYALTLEKTGKSLIQKGNKPLESKVYTKESLNFDELYTIATELNTYYPTVSSLKDYTIDSNAKAVVVGMLYHNVDLSGTKNPLDFALDLGSSDFNPGFPSNLYNTSRLQTLILDEGYSASEIEEFSHQDLYELLQIISLTETFYPGKRHPIINKETPFDLEEISELKDEACLSFGYLDYTVFTYKELYQFYENAKAPLNPISKNQRMLSDTAMRKLLKLSAVYPNFKTTLQSIMKVSDSSSDIKQILEDIKSDATGTNKELVENFMKMLLHLGMNMRGWNGEREFPIKAAFDLGTKNIESRVNESLDAIRLYEENFPQCTKILNLRLVKFQDGVYIPANQENGFTIKGRLNIIKQNKSVNACIRMSSNWILSSVYFYSSELSCPNSFNISELRYIF